MRKARRRALLALLENYHYSGYGVLLSSLPPEFTDLSIVMNLPLPTWSITRSDGIEVLSDKDVHPKIRGLLNVAIPRIKWK